MKFTNRQHPKLGVWLVALTPKRLAGRRRNPIADIASTSYWTEFDYLALPLSKTC